MVACSLMIWAGKISSGDASNETKNVSLNSSILSSNVSIETVLNNSPGENERFWLKDS